jgi:hypothetical protein
MSGRTANSIGTFRTETGTPLVIAPADESGGRTRRIVLLVSRVG